MNEVKFSEGGIRLKQKLDLSNQTNFTISIIIVTFNVVNTLQKCLKSIYSQHYTNWEIIIMDGNSTDGTVEILKDNSEKINYWRSEDDAGIYYAMNKALDYVSGNWVIFLGADDELLLEFSKMANELREPNSIYYGNVLYKGVKCSGFMSPYKMVKTGMSHQSMFYHFSIFKKHRYNLNYKISADFVLNMECWSDKTIQFIYKDYLIARYNHTGISSSHFDLLLQKNMSELVFKNFGITIWFRYMFRLFKSKLKESYLK